MMKKILLNCFFLFLLVMNGVAGEIDTIMVYSTAMHKQVPCLVVYPDNYKTSTKTFPVLYLLHGRSGNYTSWLGISKDLPKYSDAYQMIVVCPDGGDYSWYMDSPILKDFRYETFMSKELISHIDKNYRTSSDKQHRAITGLSMGGYGSLFLAFRHKDLFGAVGSISGGLDMRSFDSSMIMILGDIKEHPENWEKTALVNMADSLKNGELAITFDCGIADGFINVNRNLHQKLLASKIDHDYAERPGAHTGTYWGNSLPYHLLFFNKFFNTP